MRKEHYKITFYFVYNINMSSQKIKFGDKEVDKKNSIHLKKLFC